MDKEPSINLDDALLFTLDGHEYAIDLQVVDRVVPMAELTTLPRSRMGIRGAIDLQGRLVPVVDLRLSLGMRPKETSLLDRLIIVKADAYDFALLVDEIVGVVPAEEQVKMEADGVDCGSRCFSDGAEIDGRAVLFIDPKSLADEVSGQPAADVG